MEVDPLNLYLCFQLGNHLEFPTEHGYDNHIHVDVPDPDRIRDSVIGTFFTAFLVQEHIAHCTMRPAYSDVEYADGYVTRAQAERDEWLRYPMMSAGLCTLDDIESVCGDEQTARRVFDWLDAPYDRFAGVGHEGLVGSTNTPRLSAQTESNVSAFLRAMRGEAV